MALSQRHPQHLHGGPVRPLQVVHRDGDWSAVQQFVDEQAQLHADRGQRRGGNGTWRRGELRDEGVALDLCLRHSSRQLTDQTEGHVALGRVACRAEHREAIESGEEAIEQGSFPDAFLTVDADHHGTSARAYLLSAYSQGFKLTAPADEDLTDSRGVGAYEADLHTKTVAPHSRSKQSEPRRSRDRTGQPGCPRAEPGGGLTSGSAAGTGGDAPKSRGQGGALALSGDHHQR